MQYGSRVRSNGMKQKDIGLIITTVFFAVVIAVIFSKMVISSPKNRHQQVEVVEPISANFPEADKKYFNEQSVDPTRLIQIGDSSNPQPFKN